MGSFKGFWINLLGNQTITDFARPPKYILSKIFGT